MLPVRRSLKFTLDRESEQETESEYESSSSPSPPLSYNISQQQQQQPRGEPSRASTQQPPPLTCEEQLLAMIAILQ